MLLDHGADVNAKEVSHNQTAVMFAAGRNRDAVISLLAAHGADLNATTDMMTLARVSVDANGNPLPAMSAAASGNIARTPHRGRHGRNDGAAFCGPRRTKRTPCELWWKPAPTSIRSAPATRARRLSSQSPMVTTMSRSIWPITAQIPNLATTDGLAALVRHHRLPVETGRMGADSQNFEQDITSYLELMKTFRAWRGP